MAGCLSTEPQSGGHVRCIVGDHPARPPPPPHKGGRDQPPGRTTVQDQVLDQPAPPIGSGIQWSILQWWHWWESPQHRTAVHPLHDTLCAGLCHTGAHTRTLDTGGGAYGAQSAAVSLAEGAAQSVWWGFAQLSSAAASGGGQGSIFVCIPCLFISWAHATHCLTNNESMVYDQGWCIGSWVGVIDGFSVGLHHVGAFVHSPESYLYWIVPRPSLIPMR